MPESQLCHDLVLKAEVAEDQGCQALVVNKLTGVRQANADLKVTTVAAAAQPSELAILEDWLPVTRCFFLHALPVRSARSCKCGLNAEQQSATANFCRCLYWWQVANASIGCHMSYANTQKSEPMMVLPLITTHYHLIYPDMS